MEVKILRRKMRNKKIRELESMDGWRKEQE